MGFKFQKKLAFKPAYVDSKEDDPDLTVKEDEEEVKEDEEEVKQASLPIAPSAGLRTKKRALPRAFTPVGSGIGKKCCGICGRRGHNRRSCSFQD
jgi:hypothetical protein